jgi:hypothetical protein
MSKSNKHGGPFSVYHEHVTNPIIQELNVKIAKEAKLLHKLKHMRVQSVNKAPEWESCINVSFEPEFYDREIILNLIASKLVHDNKNPVEIVKSYNCIWVKTE